MDERIEQSRTFSGERKRVHVQRDVEKETKGSVQLRVWLFPLEAWTSWWFSFQRVVIPRGECGGKHGSTREGV